MSSLEVLKEPPFQIKEPQDNSRKTVAVIQEMPSRKPIGLLDARVCQLKASTQVVQVQGDKVEVQSCHVEDGTGRIKLQLWGDQISTVANGSSYTFTNLSTREFAGKLFLTATRKSTILQMPDMQGIPVSETASDDEADISMVTGHINAADIVILYSCPLCHTRQPTFDIHARFHKCQRCKMNQKAATYTAMGNGTLVIMTADSKRTLTISNSVLQRYLDHEGFLQLMADHEDVEEHFLDAGQFQFKLHNETVISLTKCPCERAELNSIDGNVDLIDLGESSENPNC
ncbi:hypothetical protein SKAU_G00245900 [Synaphobranchus kaupii]|nr:hypothetical protein SKAU_G00245900 [Synaphobranchus kaupii]